MISTSSTIPVTSSSKRLPAGTDTVKTIAASYTLGAEIENLTYTGATAFIRHRQRRHTISGGKGNDTLNGGTGTDTLIGGAGNDTYIVEDAGDTISEAASGGTDTVKNDNYTLGGRNREPHLHGASSFSGRAAAANTITGAAPPTRSTAGRSRQAHRVAATTPTSSTMPATSLRKPRRHRYCQNGVRSLHTRQQPREPGVHRQRRLLWHR